MKRKSFFQRVSVSVLIAVLVCGVSHFVAGDVQNINFGFKSLLHCGLIEKDGDVQSPFIEGTEKDFWVFRVGSRRSYIFFNRDLIRQTLLVVDKKLKGFDNYLHPQNVLKDHDPKQKLSKEQLEEVMRAVKGPQNPENIQNDKLPPAEEAIYNYRKYAGRCYTVKRGLFDFRNEDAIIRFAGSQ